LHAVFANLRGRNETCEEGNLITATENSLHHSSLMEFCRY